MMHLQVKPQRWMCLVTSFAMALEIPVMEAIYELGHDGSQVIWPRLPEPLCRRGFHPQELIELCHSHNYAVTRIELMPRMMPAYGETPLCIYTDEQAWLHFEFVLQNSFGVIEGVSPDGDHSHAVAYDHGTIFDPDNAIYAATYEACKARQFFMQHLWRLDLIGGSA